MSISLEEVQHIAALARLALEPEELESYRQQLARILEYFEQLQTIEPDTAGAGDKLEQPVQLRADQPYPGLNLEALMQNAPEMQAGQFRVPPVFETEST